MMKDGYNTVENNTMRPTKKFTARSRNKRQAVWDTLRAGGSVGAREAASISGMAVESARAFLRVIHAHGYTEKKNSRHRLVRDTGRIVPTINTHTNELYDYNLHPPMAPMVLKSAFDESGFDTLGQFGKAIGLGDNAATRLRHMTQGKIVVSPAVEHAVKNWLSDRRRITTL